VTYATWNLRPIDDNYLDGPEATIVEQGGTAEAIWSAASPATGATILGKVSGDTSNLDAWNFITLSKAEATAFITDNFVPFVDIDGNEYTLDKILKSLIS